MSLPSHYSDPTVVWRLPRMSQAHGSTAGLCPTTWSGLSSRLSLLWRNAPSLRAITPPPRGGTETPQRCPRSQEAFRNTTVRQFLQLPHTSSRWGCADDAAAFALCYGPRVAAILDLSTWRSPPEPPRTCTPGLPEVGHPHPGSGMTTPPFWGRTMTGLAPAGALPLQAARCLVNSRYEVPIFMLRGFPSQGTWQFPRNIFRHAGTLPPSWQ